MTTEETDPGSSFANLQVVEESGALLGLLFLEIGPAGEDDVVAVAIELNDLGFDLGADEWIEVADPAEVDQ